MSGWCCVGIARQGVEDLPEQRPVASTLEKLVHMSGMRWPIETCFEDSKQLLGMGDDEVRSWTGWHHMTLIILAHFFVVRMSLR